MQSFILRFSVVAIFSLLFGLIPVLAQAQVPSKLESVTVYQRGALLTRTGTIKLQAGEQEFVIENLERNINAGSIQLAIDRTVGIFAVEYGMSNSKEGVEPDSLILLRQELKKVRKRLAVNNIQQNGHSEELEILKANRVIAQSETTGYSASSIREATKLHNELATAARIARLELEEEAFGLKKEIKNLEQRISTIRPNQNVVAGMISAKVIAERSGTYNFELTYITNAASWNPNYDLYVQTEDEVKSQLVLAADIRQNTGVDWENVQLTLSNTDINSRLAPPMLSPIYLGGNQAYSLRSQVTGVATKRKSAEADMAMEEELVMPMQNAMAAPAT